ncbi:hypothetical protein Q8G39_28720, partial [Klebsiella pneumoniae]|uniref:hypothetical protein n=1 Tax=Klebsiella pneumoniae TaxID=573 RepID=UPI0030137F2F
MEEGRGSAAQCSQQEDDCSRPPAPLACPKDALAPQLECRQRRLSLKTLARLIEFISTLIWEGVIGMAAAASA